MPLADRAWWTGAFYELRNDSTESSPKDNDCIINSYQAHKTRVKILSSQFVPNSYSCGKFRLPALCCVCPNRPSSTPLLQVRLPLHTPDSIITCHDFRSRGTREVKLSQAFPKDTRRTGTGHIATKHGRCEAVM